MNAKDKNYLLLQFRDKIFTKNGTEYQTFFENIMEKTYPGFQRIRPYGNRGDGGNDGFRRNSGIYYQIYAPLEPKIYESKAAKKMKDNFKTLIIEWNDISPIIEYNFVFNDKYNGTTHDLERALSELKENNPSIQFSLFLAKDLEQVFISLDEDVILNLGFDIDSRKSIANGRKYLENVEVELDRENARIALKILENCKDIIHNLNNDDLILEYEILECRCLQKLEQIDKIKEKYENISIRYPKDPRPLLFLAEIYLFNKEFDKNRELLDNAAQIDNNHWLYLLEELIRKDHLGENVDISTINEKIFPDNSRIKASFYRLYAILLNHSGDYEKACYFIETAIHLNPEGYKNYSTKLSIFEINMISKLNNSQKIILTQQFLNEIEKVEKKFSEFGDILPRNQAFLNLKKLNSYYLQDNIKEMTIITQRTFELIFECYFDNLIDQLIVKLISSSELPNLSFNRLLIYLKNSNNNISDELAKELVIQFNLRNSLVMDGTKFFKEINKLRFVKLIEDISCKNYESIIKFIDRDIKFAVNIVNLFKNFPDLRRKILDTLPDNKNIQKNKLKLLCNYDEGNFETAFKILHEIDFTNMHFFECKQYLKIAQKMKAWDYEVIILDKLIEKEKDEKEIFYLKLQLSNAYYRSKQYIRSIDIGEELLKIDLHKKILSTKNKEILLSQTIQSCLERGNIDDKFLKKAQQVYEMLKFPESSFEFKVDIVAYLYLYNNEPQKALDSIIEGIKIRKRLTPVEYAKLYFILFLQIGKQIKYNYDSLTKVEDNTFIKLKNNDYWLFIGDDNELDAIKIEKKSPKYFQFINHQLGEKKFFDDISYSECHEDVIEYIFTIEKYVLWQCYQNFQKLAKANFLDGVKMVEVPDKEGTIDLHYLSNYFEDLDRKRRPIFEMYCKNKIPLAALTISEGSLLNAIGKIQNENHGFINSSTGSIDEFQKQKNIISKIINEKCSFYIDGTSALFLSEIGLIKTIYTFIQNIKVPNSVISFLLGVAEKFNPREQITGFLGYTKGKFKFSPLDNNRCDLVYNNFSESIRLFESKPANIGIISLANKANCLSEQKIPAELCDACILAQKEKIPILTDDYLYLKMNELETKKKHPDYFSSLALIRVLYEEGKIQFSEYLDYFCYLSFYRFRFLSLNSDDIENAVFGVGKIRTINPENIRKFNFSLTLSEEYGVSFQNAFSVVGFFFHKVLIDDTISFDATEKIFIELIETLPQKFDKITLGQILLRGCIFLIEKELPNFILYPNNSILLQKIEKLLKIIDLYKPKAKLWVPN
ncbi:MAG TPA: hypothetical protein PLP19_03070 [bacterium]|nr:hypothetical protein [bacterium]HPN42449.1 hypothetical protein [bacterium]